MPPSLHRVLSLLMMLTAIAATAPAAAQDHTVRIIVGYPAGATSDALTRVIAEHMSKTLQQTVIVENKAGAGGRIANEQVKIAPADGRTLLMTPVASMSIYPHSYAGQLRYDPFKDFVPVAHLANFQLGLGVQSQVPARTLADYVAWVKKDAQTHGFYASAASGSLPHFFGVMFARTAGLQLTHVPYKGTAPAMQALAAGEVSAVSTVVADIRPLVVAGKARLLAVAGARRDPGFPDVPTFKELGYDLVAEPWYALFAPAGTPPEAVERLARAVAAAVQDPALNQRLVEMGLQPTGYGPARLATIMKADYERWGPPIRASGYKPGE
ncbi:tripartite tricarboxylate transporter substrate-binding protein [Schlegelella sp. S2-27]|uniref:Tripartite tricarboxylate transporter substrate-binding protein n=1 Tax=Caldimonas mangrovi TaxID=2944811 RepID=A0ABT0YIF7_9BURK|nr:tripartite tricarboxylate transporter substrate-binding protein [Caldimonas mangrovi]MCM5678516.1 tripartite tricarboxylate transporter substrate-binding protein [Caldimonas mangrovi]